jgi:hypothetical protein
MISDRQARPSPKLEPAYDHLPTMAGFIFLLIGEHALHTPRSSPLVRARRFKYISVIARIAQEKAAELKYYCGEKVTLYL